MLSSRSFKVLVFPFKCMFHFELLYMDEVEFQLYSFAHRYLLVPVPHFFKPYSFPRSIDF